MWNPTTSWIRFILKSPMRKLNFVMFSWWLLLDLSNKSYRKLAVTELTKKSYASLLTRSLITKNLIFQIVDHFYAENGLNTTYYCLMFLAPILVFTQIKNLKYIAPFSGFANVLLVLTFMICLYYIGAEFPSFDSRPMSVPIGRLPLFIGLVLLLFMSSVRPRFVEIWPKLISFNFMHSFSINNSNSSTSLYS